MIGAGSVLYAKKETAFLLILIIIYVKVREVKRLNRLKRKEGADSEKDWNRI